MWSIIVVPFVWLTCSLLSYFNLSEERFCCFCLFEWLTDWFNRSTIFCFRLQSILFYSKLRQQQKPNRITIIHHQTFFLYLFLYSFCALLCFLLNLVIEVDLVEILLLYSTLYFNQKKQRKKTRILNYFILYFCFFGFQNDN